MNFPTGPCAAREAFLKTVEEFMTQLRETLEVNRKIAVEMPLDELRKACAEFALKGTVWQMLTPEELADELPLCGVDGQPCFRDKKGDIWVFCMFRGPMEAKVEGDHVRYNMNFTPGWRNKTQGEKNRKDLEAAIDLVEITQQEQLEKVQERLESLAVDKVD